MILITAATGQLGRRVVHNLLEMLPPSQIAVAVRTPEKAEPFAEKGVDVRHADYDDIASLRKAFGGVSRLLFISSPALDDKVRIPQHERVVKAAREAGVGHVVYTSFLGAETDPPVGPRAHFVTERALEQSGLPYTFLRNPFYTDGLLPKAFLQSCIEAGEVQDASCGRAVNSASYADLAEAIAVVLSREGHPKPMYELTGTPWTFSQLADALREASGQPIGCRTVEIADVTGPWKWLFGLICSGALERTTDDLSQLLGRSATPIKAFVAPTVSA